MLSSTNHIDFDSFFNSYYKAVYLFACKYVKDEAVAEDIIESAFIKVWEKREKFEVEVKAKSYLYKTVYHGCLKAVKSLELRVKSERGLAVVSDKFEKDCLENMIRAETLRHVYAAMEELPSECKKVFVKLFVEGKSVADAAAELNVAVSTVKNQKARGIKLLRMKLTSLFMVFSLWFVTGSL